MFGQKYGDLQRILWNQWKGPSPEYRIKDSQISENESKAIIEVIASKIEVMTKEIEFPVFFNFDPPKKVIFEIDLIKEKDYWKIIKIDLPELISERKIGERVEAIENVFIRPIRIEEYSVEGIKPAEGFKFFSFEVEYENKKIESLGFYFYSFSDWRVIDENKAVYKPTLKPASELIEPVSSVPESGPKEIKKIFVFLKFLKMFH